MFEVMPNQIVSVDQVRNPVTSGLGNLRERIANAAYLSQWRGTKKGLVMFLQIAIGVSDFEIDDQVLGSDAQLRPFHISVRAPAQTSMHRPLI
jgi:hypothetical protein